MAYSSIKKHCKNNCGRMPVPGLSGYCWTCVPEEIKAKAGNRRKLAIKKKNARLSAISRIRRQERAENGENELELWFLYHMHNSPRICENCGANLSHYDDRLWRGSQHHIIEKSKVNGCPSVATNLDNHAVLGFYCCHSQAGTSNLNLSKMPVFPLLKERFAKFEHLIAESERKKIPDIFLK